MSAPRPAPVRAQHSVLRWLINMSQRLANPLGPLYPLVPNRFHLIPMNQPRKQVATGAAMSHLLGGRGARGCYHPARTPWAPPPVRTRPLI
eukprot:2441975-Rhodomonas_salina.1